MKENALSGFEDSIGYRFKDRSLLECALTHTSYANEHKATHAKHNERMEFVGDAILDFIAAEYLFRTYPDRPEGDLSKLRASMVSEKPLSICAKELKLPDYLRLGKGEERTGGRMRDSILSDAMESVIAAVYFDGGFEEAKRLVLTHILSDLTDEDLFRDSKTPLQEYFQERNEQVLYRVIAEEGPGHAKRFTVEAYVGDRVIGTGTGSTKKAAAQEAADAAMRAMKQRK